MIVSVRCSARRHEVILGDAPTRVRVTARYGAYQGPLFAATPDDVVQQVGALWAIPEAALPHICRVEVAWETPLNDGEHLDFYEVRG